jgi:hypothetical protein
MESQICGEELSYKKPREAKLLCLLDPKSVVQNPKSCLDGLLIQARTKHDSAVAAQLDAGSGRFGS